MYRVFTSHLEYRFNPIVSALITNKTYNHSVVKQNALGARCSTRHMEAFCCKWQGFLSFLSVQSRVLYCSFMISNDVCPNTVNRDKTTYKIKYCSQNHASFCIVNSESCLSVWLVTGLPCLNGLGRFAYSEKKFFYTSLCYDFCRR